MLVFFKVICNSNGNGGTLSNRLLLSVEAVNASVELLKSTEISNVPIVRGKYVRHEGTMYRKWSGGMKWSGDMRWSSSCG